ncbi:MAG TPA: cytochrome c biogenesis protein CcsA [Flavitalea sp.]|nr:cytochrome c biogenesis protein CcsA [Flavitalea sp.]
MPPYIGEHLFPGQAGHFFIVVSLVASLVASVAYFKSANSVTQSDSDSWKRLGRVAFIVDVISVITVFGLIYLIISNHYFEYYYAYNHSDKSLNPGYLLSCIWEGQEGSFLLWAVWHGVLGIILMRTAKKWEAPVLSVISLVQACLATMILGLYIFDFKIGTNPFLLTRQFFQDAPIFNDPNYLSNARLQDGTGLNQLLQNYWMVIHPPVLFLGFASTLVPFAYAIAGLWKKDFTGWTKAAIPWALFSAAILGLGIMMGAAWAYESLTFGGFWAWDPVENASLVPWLIMVAGLHTLVIHNATGHSLRATYFFFLLSFILILYSTYLTRSGDLQDTSVHAFVTAGINWQLRIFVLLFMIPSFVLFIRRSKQIPFIAKEESSYSREFWMFIGSLVLFLSALFIIVFTSLPVINKIINTNFTISEDPEFFYNRIQVFVAILLGILTAVTQYLKYRNTERKYLVRKIGIPTLAALLVSISISYFGRIQYDTYGIGFLAAIHLALFAAVYAIIANVAYIGAGLRGKLKAAGASVAHIGFGFMLLGMLISSSKKEVLSMNFVNPLNFGPDAKEKGVQNLTLYQGVKTDMGKYWATYQKDTLDEKGKITYFQIEMERKDGRDKFHVHPNLIKNTKGQEGFSNNPGTKHYLHKDIFTYINYASTVMDDKDTSQFRSQSLDIGDTMYYSTGYLILDKVTINPKSGKYTFNDQDTAIMAELRIRTPDGRNFHATPVFQLKDNKPKHFVDTVFAQGLAVRLTGVSGKQLEISVKESSQLSPFVALKILQFPFINLLWLGTILMVIGFVMSIVRRVSLLKKTSA